MQAQDERKRLNNVRLFNPKKEIISPDTPAEVMQLARSQSKLPGPKLMSPAPLFLPNVKGLGSTGWPMPDARRHDDIVCKRRCKKKPKRSRRFPSDSLVDGQAPR